MLIDLRHLITRLYKRIVTGHMHVHILPCLFVKTLNCLCSQLVPSNQSRLHWIW